VKRESFAAKRLRILSGTENNDWAEAECWRIVVIPEEVKAKGDLCYAVRV
jgi:hypothetical protein